MDIPMFPNSRKDITLSILYFFADQPYFALAIIIIVVVSSTIIQLLSIIWFTEDFEYKDSNTKLAYFCIFGLIYRYVQVILQQICYENSKTNNTINSTIQLNELLLLQYFHIFLETIPQLCLQFYAVILFSKNPWFVYPSILITVSSLIFYSLRYIYLPEPDIKTNRLNEEKYRQYYRIIWKLVTLSIRITAILCLALINNLILFGFIAAHVIFGTVFFIYEKHKDTNCWYKTCLYSFVFACVFVFDFFNVFDKSQNVRCKMFVYYFVIFIENICIILSHGLYRMEWKLPIATFTTGFVISAILIFIYYYSPLFDEQLTEGNADCDRTKDDNKKRTLQNLHCYKEKIDTKVNNLNQADESNSQNFNTSLNNTNNDDVEFFSIHENSPNNISKENTSDEKEVENNFSNLMLLKRRGICTSIELLDENFKLFNTSPNKADINKTTIEKEIHIPQILNISERLNELASSEVMSTHDYENMCAVNINREQRGLRSWQGYLDIDAYLHDDSTVHEKRWDTLTTSSEMSGRYDYVESIRSDSDHYNCDSETYIFKAKPFVPFISDHSSTLYPVLGPLETITEEGSEESIISLNLSPSCHRQSSSSISTLVATIDEIRLGNISSPLQYYFTPNPIESEFNIKETSRKYSQISSGLTLDQILFLSELTSSSLVDDANDTTIDEYSLK